MQKVKAGLNEYARAACAKNKPETALQAKSVSGLRILMKNQVIGSLKRQLSGLCRIVRKRSENIALSSCLVNNLAECGGIVL